MKTECYRLGSLRMNTNAKLFHWIYYRQVETKWAKFRAILVQILFRWNGKKTDLNMEFIN